MPGVGFEPTISVLELAKTFRALSRVYTGTTLLATRVDNCQQKREKAFVNVDNIHVGNRLTVSRQ
jgi:hypothetical protein